MILQRKKGGWPKGKKRKRTRDTNAPKQPLTGYVRFLNDRREKIRADNPTLSFSEITKLLGAEWTKLAADDKQVFVDFLDFLNVYPLRCPAELSLGFSPELQQQDNKYRMLYGKDVVGQLFCAAGTMKITSSFLVLISNVDLTGV